MVDAHLGKASLQRTTFETSRLLKMKAPDSKTGLLKHKNIVTKEALDATDAARAALKRGDVASFGVDPAAWAIIEALPDYINYLFT